MVLETGKNLAIQFLRNQMNEVDRKIERFQTALDDCDDNLERNGVQASLHEAQVERDVLQDLLMNQLDEKALSLDALILQQGQLIHREVSRLSGHWHRGQATPPAYWDAQVKQGFLTELLGHFHAQQDKRPYYVSKEPIPREETVYAEAPFPWFGAPGQPAESSDEAVLALRADIFGVLRKKGLPIDHVRIMIESDGQVVVAGIAHSTKERRSILKTIEKIEEVHKILADLQVTDEEYCPICNAEAEPPGSDQSD